MRIFLPLLAEDRTVIAASGLQLDLGPGRAAWAVTAGARADRSGEEEEDLEYDAIQDATHIALSGAEPDARAMVIAADVPDAAVQSAEETGGAYGVVTATDARAKIASLHVTELDAQSAAADDTDPALLWFDVSEGAEALAFLDASPAG